MKKLFIHCKNNENHEIIRTLCQKHENNENLNIPRKNYENHEIHTIQRQKKRKSLKFNYSIPES